MRCARLLILRPRLHQNLKSCGEFSKLERLASLNGGNNALLFFLIHLVKPYPKTCVPQSYLRVVVIDRLSNFNNFLSFLTSKGGHAALFVWLMIVLIKLIKLAVSVSVVHEIGSSFTNSC